MKYIPEKFLDQMKDLLEPKDFADFLEDMEKQPYRGIRVNTLKCGAEKLMEYLPFKMEKTPFSQDGFYIPYTTENIGNDPFHHAGAFYVQEPSASSAVTVLDVRKGDRVLDLCAAPGGKSTQIAAALGSTGLLWSNEIVRSRANILLSNIERMGISNAVVSSCHPETLCCGLEGYFDRVLVDAPCSGEGMFRKDETAPQEWSLEHSAACGERQLSILESASKALKKGGIMVYSTCTFSVFENENVIEKFIEIHDDFELVDSGVDFGRKALEKAVRILPRDGGEGHFVAKLRKKGEWTPSVESVRNVNENFAERESALKLYDEIFVNRPFGENFLKIKDKILIAPEFELPDLKGLGVIRAGLLFGEIKKNRIEPCHAVFIAAQKKDLRSFADLKYNDVRLKKFFHGEEIEVSEELKGYTAVLVEGVSAGFGKASAGRLKNKYPKGLRTLGKI